MDPTVKQLQLHASLESEEEQENAVVAVAEEEEERSTDEKIALYREILELYPPEDDDEDRSTFLNALVVQLWNRYKELGAMEDLEEAIVLDREVLALRPPGNEDRWISLNNLAVHLSDRYEQFGGIEDINEAIVLDREALSLRQLEDSGRSISLINLASHLGSRYKHLGKMDDLNEAIDLDREALALCPPGNLRRAMPLNTLSVHLLARYHQCGQIHDLNEAIVCDRETLLLRPPGHQDRSISLNNLGVYLATRYDQLGAIEDLNEAIDLGKGALFLRPSGHPERPVSLNNVTISLATRYKHEGKIEDLDESITLSQDALLLRPPGHPSRCRSLNSLADRLFTRCNLLHDLECLDNVVDLGRDALTVCPLSHPDRSKYLNSLALYLFARHQRRESVEDLDESVANALEALKLRPPGHPNRSRSLETLALCFSIRDQEKSFSLCCKLPENVLHTLSSDDLSAANTWVYLAEKFRHPTTPLAYETVLRFLVCRLATLPSLPQHLVVLKKFTASLAMDAFSACLRYSSPTKAVELLEQGRGVFWSQLTRLRSPLDEVAASGQTGEALANEFMRLSSLIHNILNSETSSADQHDRICRLNVDLERVVTDIRQLPGLSRFLLPSLFTDLRQAASQGPVIIVNASKYSCDALIVSIQHPIVHIPLTITQEQVQALSSELRTLVQRAKKMDKTKEFTLFLRELWDHIVSHIADKLLSEKYPIRSRIWWCPTAEFSLLLLHAAAPYRQGKLGFSSLYVSSYTPTLNALIRARLPCPSITASRVKRFVAIGQANAIGTSELIPVSTELDGISQLVKGCTEFKCIEKEEACISRVTEELGRNQWVHLACHGIPKRKRPFESAFALHDERLTVQRIIQCDLQNPEFAYLSACHTTVGDEESPDEAIHLAAAMQFAGFPSVIGTMWSVDDAQASKIASVFYKYMMDESGCLDHTRAARALWKTTKVVKAPLDQRILYVHLGV